MFKPCPFLGCRADRATVCGYPSQANVCFVRPVRRATFIDIPLDHQEFHCLAAFAECRSYRDRLIALGNGGTVSARSRSGSGLLRSIQRILGR